MPAVVHEGPNSAEPIAPPRNRKNAKRATAVPRASGASSVARVWSVVWRAMYPKPSMTIARAKSGSEPLALITM